MYFFFFKQKTAYEMRISDWSSDVCSSDLRRTSLRAGTHHQRWNAALQILRRTDAFSRQGVGVERRDGDWNVLLVLFDPPRQDDHFLDPVGRRECGARLNRRGEIGRAHV